MRSHAPSLTLLGVLAIAVGSVFFVPASARALPRFAARTGMACVQCHVSPGGGGMRNAYGRNIFARTMLPMVGLFSSESPTPSGSTGTASPGGDDSAAPFTAFSGDVTDWLAVGTDVRAAYIFSQPDRGITADAPPSSTSSFFLMQADLYVGATLGDHVRLVLDLGVYSGFEAWALFNVTNDPEFELYVRLGRFMPTFGIREVEHQLFTREGIGLGASDRDTGLEATAILGPFTLAVALTNGTLGDTAFDTHGGSRRTFEKAITSRLAASMHLGPLRLQLGASASWNENLSQANPMFGNSLPASLSADVSRGVDEVRVGGFATVNFGRFTWLGDLVWVRDEFYAQTVAPIFGYASYQELSFLAMRGLDVVATFEYMDPDMEVVNNYLMRAGLVVEVFPLPFVELRVMGRRLWADQAVTGGAWDLVVFAHLFM